MYPETSLLSQIPLPTQQSQPAKPVTPVASVKIGDVEDSLRVEPNGFFEKLKAKLVEYRMNKIEAKSPEQRTPNEQAEYEANLKNINCVI